MRIRCLLVVLLAFGLPSQGLTADDYPNRPITMVIPFAAGGPADVLGRMVANKMAEVLGQRIVVENPSGAGGTVGTMRVARSPADGYQFVLGTVGSFAQNQTLYRQPSYNAQTDFSQIGLIAEAPLVIIARKNLPADDLKGFVALAKSGSSPLSYGSAGPGTAVHLGCVLLDIIAGTQGVHVPYRGTSVAMQDLMGERLDYLCEVITTAKGPIDDGSVKAIAIMNKERSPALPNVQTTSEQGLAGAEAYTWWALFLPKNVPDAVVKKLNRALGIAIDDPVVKERIVQLGASPVVPSRRTPEYLAGFVKSEIEKWAVPIKKAGIMLD